MHSLPPSQRALQDAASAFVVVFARRRPILACTHSRALQLISLEVENKIAHFELHWSSPTKGRCKNDLRTPPHRGGSGAVAHREGTASLSLVRRSYSISLSCIGTRPREDTARSISIKSIDAIFAVALASAHLRALQVWTRSIHQSQRESCIDLCPFEGTARTRIPPVGDQMDSCPSHCPHQGAANFEIFKFKDKAG